jgi:hypothetical protein
MTESKAIAHWQRTGRILPGHASEVMQHRKEVLGND